MVDEQRERWAVVGLCIFEHLRITRGVAGCDDRTPTEQPLETSRLDRALVRPADHGRRAPQSQSTGLVPSKFVVDLRTDDTLRLDAVEVLRDDADKLGATRSDQIDVEPAPWSSSINSSIGW